MVTELEDAMLFSLPECPRAPLRSHHSDTVELTPPPPHALPPLGALSALLHLLGWSYYPAFHSSNGKSPLPKSLGLQHCALRHLQSARLTSLKDERGQQQGGEALLFEGIIRAPKKAAG